MNERTNSQSDSEPKFRSNSDEWLDRFDEELLSEDSEVDPSGVTQELTAYLDGELSAAEVIQVEQRLSKDPEYLAQMQAMQRTWEAFDAISTEDVGDSFMRTTMEMVVADAKSSVMSSVSNKVRYARPVLAILIPLVVFSISYAWTRRVQTQPHRLLQQNLDVIERYDQYQKADFDLDFLLKLKQRGLFADRNDFDFDQMDDLKDVVGGMESKSDPEILKTQSPDQRLASMSLSETQQLKLNFDAYTALSPEKLVRVEEFHRQLTQHPDQIELLSVLNTYYQWLKSLGPSDKARLLDADVDSRLNEISKLLSEQNQVALGRQGSTRLPLNRDQEHLMNWFDFTINSNEPLFRREFPRIVSEYQKRSPTAAQVPLSQLTLFSRRAPLKQIVAILIRADRSFIQDTIYQDVDLLKRGLSFEAQVIIADQDPENQKTLILNWLETLNRAKSAIPEEKLQAFYEQLPADQRDQLDRMSMEDWTTTLSRMYREKNAPTRIDEEPLFFDDF